MLKPKPPAATYSDLEALPPHMVGEILYGALHAHPRPAPRHGLAANRFDQAVTAPPFEAHTFALNVLWVEDQA